MLSLAQVFYFLLIFFKCLISAKCVPVVDNDRRSSNIEVKRILTNSNEYNRSTEISLTNSIVQDDMKSKILNSSSTSIEREKDLSVDIQKSTDVIRSPKQAVRETIDKIINLKPPKSNEKIIKSAEQTWSKVQGTFSGEWNRRKQAFLDKIGFISEALLKSDAANLVDEAGDDEEITQQSDLRIANRSICVVTTAALPWMTGTAVNPLLRAAYFWRKSHELQTNVTQSDSAGIYNTTRGDALLSSGEINATNTTVAAKIHSPQENKQLITLVIPWLELEEDRLVLYGDDNLFKNQSEQEEYIRNWMREKAGLEDAADPETGLKILFYPARYHSGLRSIFAMGDICSYIESSDADVCILEEPEHLNWYRAPGSGWTNKFNYVVGVVHTNYKEYASGHYSGLWTSPAIGFLSSAMVRAYCHKVIKLSDVLQIYAPEKEVTSNVHGVRSEFLEEGKRRGEQSSTNSVDLVQNNDGIYFIGKILWAKGFDPLLELEDFYKQCTGSFFSIDIYGNGPDEKEIKRAFYGRKMNSLIIMKDEENRTLSSTEIQANSMPEYEKHSKNTTVESIFTFNFEGQGFDMQSLTKRFNVSNLSDSIKSKIDSIEIDLPQSLYELRKNPIPAQFLGRIDHSLLREKYKIFINPSVSEVLCTTTAEALAMGKFAIIPVHPSNDFFMKFPNCLAYRNKMEFAANLRWALSHEPEPLSKELAYEFTWEAATERFIQSAAISNFEARNRSKLRKSKIDDRIAWFHNEIGKGVKGDVIRKVLGAGPASDQVKYEMEKREVGLLGNDEYAKEDEIKGFFTRKFNRSHFARALGFAF